MRYSKSNIGSSKTTNRAGGEAFNMAPIEQLVQIVTTNLMNEPKYYGDVSKVMDSAIESVAKTNPEFILKLASYTRNEMYLRTVSIYLLVKAANMPETKQFVRKYTPYIIKRADEIYEALACHIQVFSGREYPKEKGHYKIPNSLKKGIAEVFPNFDEYQFAKYNRPTGVGFKFAIMKCRPKEPSELIKKILDDKLEIPYTWETELSAKGNKPEVWHPLIDSGKVGYMALLRNLNSMDRAG
ncbi:TROVE domain-containing protein, partial [Candidatus Woesearchaeota archaeon]|nr:TROVE domain-containing protein [Candidatus Woesearchaeota archaeon]